MRKVVIVESPAKAKTINRYLGNDYYVIASFGHIRDLPSKDGSVNPDDDFSMTWEVGKDSKKHITEIANAVKDADELYLATDPDREGEAISWHVLKVLEEKKLLKNKPVHRIVFNQVTKSAIQDAIAHPRQVNKELVEAYLARRALDYLVGFSLSPVLWRKLPGSKSAGRVQSVALRLIVDREQEIESFVTREYWSILADLKTERDDSFQARLTHLNGKKLDKFDLGTEEQALAAVDAIKGQDFSIQTIERKQVKRNPAAPFITSTLQQEASRKLGFSARKTMQVAQKLYEGIALGGELTGIITYMRTDSIHMAPEAIVEIREAILSEYGKSYLPDSPRVFKSKAKNAQEAHEAIRPTSILRKPAEIAKFLDADQLKLYTLIWKRAKASQMENAIFDKLVVDILSKDQLITLRANGSAIAFDGFLRLYQEGVDDEATLKDDEDSILPKMSEGEGVKKEKITPNQHFTQPPPRYSEASLVKKLEELGIGRPSTYASIISVLQQRQYVRLDKRQFFPENRGRLVTAFLLNFFKQYVEYDFTAHLEDKLDDISAGTLDWKQVLTDFWKPFIAKIDEAKGLTLTQVLDNLQRDLDHFLFGEDEKSRDCPKCKDGKMSLKLSRFGAFLGCSNYPDCSHTTPLIEADAHDDEDHPAVEVFEPKVIGDDPKGGTITLRKGPFGFYLQWDGLTPSAPAKGKKAPKPKRVAVPKDVDPLTVTLEKALSLSALPKDLGKDPATGEMVSVGLGRFGPYVKHSEGFASVPKGEDVLSLSLERALEIIAEKKAKTIKGNKS